MAIVNVNPRTAARPQFGFSAQAIPGQGGGGTFTGAGAAAPGGPIAPAFSAGGPPVYHPSMVPEISAPAPDVNQYLMTGTSAQIPGFDPMLPGGGFYPGLLGTGQEPARGGMEGEGPQMYFGAGGAGYGSQSGAARSFDTMTTQGQAGQAVGNVLRSGYTIPVTNTINEGIQLARQQRARPSAGFGLLTGGGGNRVQPMPAPNRIGNLL